MFRKRDMGVLGWLFFFILLTIPVLNVIFIIWILFSSRVNRSLKNVFVAFFIITLLHFVGILSGTFESLVGLFG